MLFQTYEFLIFFLIVAVTSYIAKKRARQVCLLIASIFFYAWGSIPHTPLFLFVILWTYLFGILIEKRRSKIVLAIGIGGSFCPLLLYKYVPFLIGQIFSSVPTQLSFVANLSLPIGISFYTFQAVGYLVDVYRKDQPAERDLIVYSLFVSFFPQLVAGPIERSTNLINQLKEDKPFCYDDVAVGLRLMGIGLFLKVFVADTLGTIVDSVYNNVYEASTSAVMLLLATFFFGIQIYCDFNGYSTIAMGSAKILGVNLMTNFERPYFSRSITEFWRRWHRSLSFWFRDYVFIPLGGSRCGKARGSLNLFITFLLSGIWHGANWTFAIWGALNGILLIIEKALGLGKKDKSKWGAVIGWIYTYVFVNFAWIFFRSRSIEDALAIIKKIIYGIVPELVKLMQHNIAISSLITVNSKFILGVIGVILLLVLGLYENKKGSLANKLSKFHPIVRWSGYICCMSLTLCFGEWGSTAQFIYFRF